MMLFTARTCLLLCWCFYNLLSAKAQLSPADRAYHTAAVDDAVQWYHRSLHPETGLYNGIVYTGYSLPFFEGNPYFLSSTPGAGSLQYDGVRYENIPVLFDMAREQVIVSHPSGMYKVSLINERLQEFTLLNHTFVQINAHGNPAMRTGFYELLYSGKVLVLKKIKKTIREELSPSSGVLLHVQERSAYFIQKDSLFFPVSGSRSVLRVFRDRKKELEQFIRKSNLHIAEDPDNGLVKITAYYEALNK